MYLPLLAAWVVALASPGPDVLAVLRTGASRGRRDGMLVGAGVVCGIGLWAVLALTGLSLLLARFAKAYLVLRTVGAVFLLAYGLHILWGVWRSRGGGPAQEGAPGDEGAGSGWRHWRLGLATNLANPKAVVFFGALFATVLPPHLSVAQRAEVLAAMLVMALAWFSLVATVAGAQAVMRGYRRAERTVDAVAGGLFAAVGVALLPR